MRRTVVIIQARYGSTRLPGKVLLDLSGKTVLERVLERCLAIEAADVVCCAVPNTPDSDLVSQEAERVGVAVYRGSEDDVLGRYYGAAQMMDAGVVLRVTSDCPLIDPNVCSQVIALRAEKHADYACNNMPASWPHGLDCEAIPFHWLERAHREAKTQYQREHVTPFVRTHLETTKVNLPCPEDGLSDCRWTLDTPRDFAFMEAIFKRIGEGAGTWSWRVPFEIVRDDPGLAAINRGETTPARTSSVGEE